MKSKSGNKKLWIAVIIFVLMIAGAIGNHSDNKKEKPDRESSVATETQIETQKAIQSLVVIRRILLPRESSVIPIRQMAVPPDRCRCIS
mgnify:CR=1 FL=1